DAPTAGQVPPSGPRFVPGRAPPWSGTTERATARKRRPEPDVRSGTHELRRYALPPAISGVDGPPRPPPAPLPPGPTPSRRNVTGRARASTSTTLRAGSVSATTRPLRTTSRAAGRRRIASASSAQSETTKLEGQHSAV